jgi:hypothetical protein
VNIIYSVLGVVGAVVLVLALSSGAAVLACALVPVVLIWLAVRAWDSPMRKDLGWLFKGLLGAGTIIFLLAVGGGFLVPVLVLVGVFAGLPLLLSKALKSGAKPVPDAAQVNDIV